MVASSISPAYSERMATAIRRGVTGVVIIIAGLAFAFSFGNGFVLGVQLGVPRWLAILVAPAVDLSVLGLLVAVQFLRAQGVTARMLGPRLLLFGSGLATFVINVAKAVVEHHYGRAEYDAVPPLLLLGWGEVGPKLLTLIHSAGLESKDDTRTVRTAQDERMPIVLAVPDEIGPSSQLVASARKVDVAHRAATGRAISRDKLRAQLKVSNAVAGELIRLVRSTSQDGGTA